MRERERYFLPTGSFPTNAHSSHKWDRLRARASSGILVSHVGAGARALGPSSAVFLGTLAQNQIEVGTPSMWDASAAGSSATTLAQVVSHHER